MNAVPPPAPPERPPAPRVSVVMPCYDMAAYVGEAVASVRAQALPDWELVVVDDGSADGSAAAAEAAAGGDGRVRVLRRSNGGVSAARNGGYAASDGRSAYVVFLDADDALEPGMLGRLVGYLDARPHVGMAYCDPLLVDDAGRPLADQSWPGRMAPGRGGRGVRAMPPNEPSTPFASVYALAGIVPSLVVLRRSVYDRAGGWDEAFGQPCEDTDLFLRMALEADVHYLPERLVRRRHHAAQSVSNLDHLDAQRDRLFARWQRVAAERPEHAATVRAAERFRQRTVAYGGLRAALAHLRARRPLTAARYAGGALRRALFPDTFAPRPR